MATKVNLYIDQGSVYTTTMDVTDENGDPIDYSEHSSLAQIRKTYTSLTAVTMTSSFANGTMTLSLSSNASANMEAGRYVYDVYIWTNADSRTRFIEGIVTINPRATQW